MTAKADYGTWCNARFWPQPHERSCVLAPGHRDHASSLPEPVLVPARGPLDRPLAFDMNDRFQVLQWAGGRPGVLRLLAALQKANYDDLCTEYLCRVVRAGAAKVVGKCVHGVSLVDECGDCRVEYTE